MFKLHMYDDFEDIGKKEGTFYSEEEVFNNLFEIMKEIKPSFFVTKYYQSLVGLGKTENLVDVLLQVDVNEWKDITKEMKALSQRLPYSYFVLTTESPHKGQFARFCFHNGKKSGGFAQLTYPPIKQEDFLNE